MAVDRPSQPKLLTNLSEDSTGLLSFRAGESCCVRIEQRPTPAASQAALHMEPMLPVFDKYPCCSCTSAKDGIGGRRGVLITRMAPVVEGRGSRVRATPREPRARGRLGVTRARRGVTGGEQSGPSLPPVPPVACILVLPYYSRTTCTYEEREALARSRLGQQSTQHARADCHEHRGAHEESAGGGV